MKISPISFKQTYPQKILSAIKTIKVTNIGTPQFSYDLDLNTSKVYRGQMLCSDNETVFNRHSTYMFRQDLDWNIFGQYLKEKYKDEDEVNCLIYACSDGSEAYTMSIILQEIFQNEASKFFPIKAIDINQKLIDENKKRQNGNIDITYNESMKILRFKKFDEKTKKWTSLSSDEKANYSIKRDENRSLHRPFSLTQKVKNPVVFEQGNILEDIERIDPKRKTIVMARNMWPYVDPCEYEDFAKKLYEKLAKGSIVVLGDYDFEGERNSDKNTFLENSNGFPKALIKAGFSPSKTQVGIRRFAKNLIFEK